MEPPLNYYYNSQGREWEEKHYWVKTLGKSPNQVLKEIYDKLSVQLTYQKNAELCEQVQFLLHMYHPLGTSSVLYKDMDHRIEGFNTAKKFKLSKRVSEINRAEISEAKFNIQYFAPRAVYPDLAR
jgi:hypothetical protein